MERYKKGLSFACSLALAVSMAGTAPFAALADTLGDTGANVREDVYGVYGDGYAVLAKGPVGTAPVYYDDGYYDDDGNYQIHHMVYNADLYEYKFVKNSTDAKDVKFTLNKPVPTKEQRAAASELSIENAALDTSAVYFKGFVKNASDEPLAMTVQNARGDIGLRKLDGTVVADCMYYKTAVDASSSNLLAFKETRSDSATSYSADIFSLSSLEKKNSLSDVGNNWAYYRAPLVIGRPAI